MGYIEWQIDFISDLHKVGALNKSKTYMLVTENNPEYKRPNSLMIDFMEIKASLPLTFGVGDVVRVYYNTTYVRNEQTQRIYNNIKGWKIEPIQARVSLTE